jgi:hypothetical protein
MYCDDSVLLLFVSVTFMNYLQLVVLAVRKWCSLTPIPHRENTQVCMFVVVSLFLLLIAPCIC